MNAPDEIDHPSARYGDVLTQPQENASPNDQVTAVFWTGRPSNGYRRDDRYFTIERQKEDSNSEWEPILRDGQWEATFEWKQIASEERIKNPKPQKIDPYGLNPQGSNLRPEPYQMTVTWTIPPDTEPGTYRIVPHGRVKKDCRVERFNTTTSSFAITK